MDPSGPTCDGQVAADEPMREVCDEDVNNIAGTSLNNEGNFTRDSEDCIIFNIPGLDAEKREEPSSDNTGETKSLTEFPNPSCDNSDDFDIMTEAFKVAISEESSHKDETSKTIEGKKTSSPMFDAMDEDSCNKFDELESRISDILSNISKNEQVECVDDEEIKDGSPDNNSSNVTSLEPKSQTPDKKLDDFEDASMDGGNDGDMLGLLAETEGRERHSSDAEDDEDEEGDADIEMEEEHLESGVESDANVDEGDSNNDEDDEEDGECSNDDEEYEPKSSEDEDDEDEDVDDPELKTFRKRKNLLKDLRQHTDESYAGMDNEPSQSQTSFQTDTDIDVSESKPSDVNTDDTIQCDQDTNISATSGDNPLLSISCVTSLAINAADDTKGDDTSDSTVLIDQTGSDTSKHDVPSSLLLTALTKKGDSMEKAPSQDDNKEFIPDASPDTSVASPNTEISSKNKDEMMNITKLPLMQEQSVPDFEAVENATDVVKGDSERNNLVENIATEAQPMEVDDENQFNKIKDVEKDITGRDEALNNDIPVQDKHKTSDLSDEAVADAVESNVSKENQVKVPSPATDLETDHKTEKAPESTAVNSEMQSAGERMEVDPIKEKKTTLQVFSLDSDDECSEQTSKSKTTVNEDKMPSVDSNIDTSIAKSKKMKKDRIEKRLKSNEKCINPTCLESNDLFPCPLYIPSLFRARDTPNIPKACKDCLDEGISLMENLSSQLRAGYCLLDVEVPNIQDLVEISDSDSDDDSKGNNNRIIKGGWRKKGLSKPTADELVKDSEKDYINQVLPDLFSKVWLKFNIDKQIQLCEDNLLKKMSALDDECSNMEKMINSEQVQLDKIRTELYETFRYPTECKVELIITENGDHLVQNSLIPERRSGRLKKQNLSSKPDVPVPSSVEAIPTPTADSVAVADYNSLTVPVENLPSKGKLPDYALNVGDNVYAVRQSIFGAWCLAQIVRVMPRGTKLANGTLSQFSLISVHFVQGGEGELVTKQVTGRQVAYATPSPVVYSVGTRVIALFQNKQQLKEAYYSGVIAEIPVRANRYRYLVFFDDGYSRYVFHKFILLVCQRSTHAWEDVHPDSRDFIRKYLQGFPNQPMVRVQAGQPIRAEYKGKFLMASVVAVDASLALIKFNDNSGAPSNHEEWIYRGSTRLEPLFIELQTADRKSHGRHRASYATTNLNKSKHFPYVEYSRPDQGEGDSENTITESQPSPVKNTEEVKEQTSSSRAVAKKSTSNKEDTSKSKDKEDLPTQQIHADQVKSKVVYYSPKVTIKPKKFVTHACGPDCQNKDAIALRELRTYNPLARPLLSGWQRLIIKYRGKRTIMYLAPCGRRLRNSKELHIYLRTTRSQMSVDLFDFDHWVHCLAEFVPTKCYVSKKDLSHGVEAVPVPCVNYYDHTLPEFSAYSTRRIPTRGVNLNLDEEFLCGCDCTDDCQDRNKCQCWQLTLEGASVIGSQTSRVGYQYKRLLEPVPTGIYECNSRCKCAATCLNRVVQHPLQLKLQVFKTFNRGWGIRALNDVSRGTFICIYAGNLLTDAVANVDGVTEGDEYLAELDYIEVVEKLKENYESDVPEEDKDFDEDSEEPSDNEKESSSAKDKKTGGQYEESDEEFKPHKKIGSDESGIATQRQLRKKKSDRNKNGKDEKSQDTMEVVKEKEPVKETAEKTSNWDEDGAVPVVDEFITISDDEEKREPSRFAAPDDLNDDDKYTPKHRSVRSFFGKDEACYIMDAKVQGNLGRYLNHSCLPNVFVQNVFVDTHDPRFPWVAFFTLNHVRAGTELTWNYNYDVGSVPGKVMFCRCGASNCRGRLL